jgi:hypothetical protein
MLFTAFPSERPSSVALDSIWIFHRLRFGYLGLDRDGLLSAIFPVEGRLPLMGRSAGALRIEYHAGVRIQIDDLDEVSSCCIVTVSDRSLDRSFWALAQALAQEFAEKPGVTATDCGRAFSAWEQLFQRRRRLSLDEEQGLWGELFFLTTCAAIESAIGCWRGPNAEDYDFLSNGIALEVKTSRRVGRHNIGHAQVIQATEAGHVFLVSIWVGEDPFHGVTLPQMVDLISEKTKDPVAFEGKLLDTGYSHKDRRLYDRAFSVLDAFSVYDMIVVPRVREADPGVMSLSYVVQLDPAVAQSAEDQEALLARVFS